MDCSPLDFSVHGISQARILEWVAISFSRGSSQPRNQKPTSPSLAGRFFTTEPPVRPSVPLSLCNFLYKHRVKKTRWSRGGQAPGLLKDFSEDSTPSSFANPLLSAKAAVPEDQVWTMSPAGQSPGGQGSVYQVISSLSSKTCGQLEVLSREPGQGGHCAWPQSTVWRGRSDPTRSLSSARSCDPLRGQARLVVLRLVWQPAGSQAAQAHARGTGCWWRKSCSEASGLAQATRGIDHDAADPARHLWGLQWGCRRISSRDMDPQTQSP